MDQEAPMRAILKEVTMSVAELLTQSGAQPRSMIVRAGDIAIELSWDAQPVAAPAAVTELPAGRSDAHHVGAPTVGVFYVAPSPGADPFVQPGDVVSAGQQLGIVEAMKLMIPVKADRAGVIIDVLRKDGEEVEHDEPLFELGLA